MSDPNFALILKDLKVKYDNLYSTNPKNTATMTDFELYKILGCGAFGRVILTKHKATSLYYAIKILSKKQIVETKQTAYAVNEKKLLVSLKHPYFISLAYSFQDNSYLYMVLEFIIGGEMFTLLRSMKRFNETLTQFYAAQVCMAFEYLQYLSIAYRDLKPENLLINGDGYIKVADLGFAKHIPNQRTWTVCGTPDYMAPEVLTNKGYHWAADWWAYGVLIYEMTHGYPPFVGKDEMKKFGLIMKAKYSFSKSSGISADVKDLMSHLIQTDLSKRYGNLENGVKDIKNHAFFKDVDWLALYNKQIKPPYKPKVKGPSDTSAFDEYKEEKLNISDELQYPTSFLEF